MNTITAYPHLSHSPGLGSYYLLSYKCPLTERQLKVPVRKSGRFPSRKDAEAWADKNLRSIVDERMRHLQSRDWSANDTIVRHVEAYSRFRIEQNPRSARQDLSVLKCFALPFFVSVMREPNPNNWGEFGEELLEWLKDKAKTRRGEPLAVSTANKVVNALNHFMKWMRKKKIIEYKNYRMFEAFDQRKQNRRGVNDLVSPEVFQRVHKALLSVDQLYADLWLTQRHTGLRINELLGLAVNWLSEECPDYLREEFEPRGLTVYGSLYLESQPARPYIKRVNGIIERAPLKWRKEIGLDYSRTIPILDEGVWQMLVQRYQIQKTHWEAQSYGPIKESYLLFDGAQRNKYLEAIHYAYMGLGLESAGSHVLRHTLSTEWSQLKISSKTAEIVLGHKTSAHERYVHLVGLVNAERLKASPLPDLGKSVGKSRKVG